MTSKRAHRQCSYIEGLYIQPPNLGWTVQKPVERALDDLIDTLEELEVLDQAEEAEELLRWCKALPESTGTPSLTHSPRSSVASSDSSVDPEGLRHISSNLFSGSITRLEGKSGTIRGRTGTHYAFSISDIADYNQADRLKGGLPVTFEAAIDAGRTRAVHVRIDWGTVLLRSLAWSWSGPPLPEGLTVTLEGKILTWDSSRVTGRVAIFSPSAKLKATIHATEAALNEIDRAVCSTGFPCTVDISRRKDEINYRVTSIRVRWRPVLETYAAKQALKSPFHSILKASPRIIVGVGVRTTSNPSKRQPPRPSSAILEHFDSESGAGVLEAQDGSLLQFTLGSWPKNQDTELEVGKRLFYWPTEKPGGVIAILDKLYITHSEWSGQYGGEHSAAGTGASAKAGAHNFARLPFDCCALTLKPFETPMATSDGVVYDLLAIIPYLRKHGTDPVTGKKLSVGDLIKLNFVKNQEGEFNDPLTFKPFNQHTHLVAIKTSGNVHARETIDRLNIKPGHWHDLVSDEPFTKADIITLQDPHNVEGRDLSQFHHLQNNLKADKDESEGGSLSGINMSAIGGAAAQLRSIAKGKEKAVEEEKPEPVATEDAVKPLPKKDETAKNSASPYNAAAYSTGRTAASLTSTSADIVTKSERELIDEEEYMYERIKEKAYVRLVTNFGNINVELHADRAPQTCYNFVMLAKQGKYANTVFHRLIPGFMIQGGDPTGTGRGGESYWGKPFQDEFHKRNAFRHDARGIMSMANHGHWTNGSQFFFTFRATPHLDHKHTVFGRVVGGMDVLDRMEKVAPDPATDRPTRPIKLLDVEVFKDPYEDYQKRLQKRLAREKDEADVTGTKRAAREAREKDRTTWFGTNLGDKQNNKVPEKPKSSPLAPSSKSDGVGKYLNTAKRPAAEAEAAANEEMGKKKRKAGNFGDFSAW